MTKKEKKNLWPRQQMMLESEIDFQKTYEKLESSTEIIGLELSGGSTQPSVDSGCAIFAIKNLPWAKFSISPFGKIQIMSSDPTKFGKSEAAVYKYLVARDEGEFPHYRDITKNEIVLDDPSLPFPTLPRLEGKDDYNSKRMRQIDFYADLREDLLYDLKKTESIIEALLKDEKTAICVGFPPYGLRLKHEQAIFIGKGWSKSEIIETLNLFERIPCLYVPIKDKENEETETA